MARCWVGWSGVEGTAWGHLARLLHGCLWRPDRAPGPSQGMDGVGSSFLKKLFVASWWHHCSGSNWSFASCGDCGRRGHLCGNSAIVFKCQVSCQVSENSPWIFFFVFVIIQIESRRAEPVFSQNVVYRPAAPDPLVSLLTHRFSVPVSGRLIGISVRRALEINILGCSPKILMFTKVQEALP